jgi:FixJ family two-component response regulator
MLGANGWEIHRRLFKLGSRIPVIFISAAQNGGLKDKALHVGAVGLLLKPFSAKDLIAMIDLAFGTA